METILEKLGPNKVTVPICEVAKFTQKTQQKREDVTDVYALFPTPLKSHHANLKVATPSCANVSQKEIVRLHGNTFMIDVMKVLHPSTTLICRNNDMNNELVRFKRDMAKDLDNEHQWFKRLGFTKKRSVSVQGLQDEINDDTTDFKLSFECLYYLAHRLDMNVAILNGNALKRIDVFFDASKPWRCYIIQSDNTFACVPGVDTKQGVDVQALSLYKEHNDVDWAHKKIQPLRDAYKFFTGYIKASGTKAELIEVLTKKTT